MKRRHLLLVALSLILSICMCFCLAACDSCNDETEPVQLATPVVTVDADGVARWSAIENASGYAYKISNGEEKNTDATSVTLTDGQSIAVKAVGDGVNFTDSGYSEAKTYTKPAQPVKLGTPTVTIDDNGLATWAAVPNASGYMVKIGDTETEQTELTKQLTDGQSIQVKAVGNGTTFTTGDYSAVQTYTATEPDEHVHAYTYTPNEDGATHNGVCTAEGECDAKNITDEAHVYDNDTDATCNKCDYERDLGGDPEPEPELLTHAEYIAAETGSKIKVSGVVSAVAGKNIYFQDADGGYYLYNLKTVPETLVAGKTITVIGTKDVYNGLHQVKDATVEVSDAEPASVAVTDITEIFTAATAMNAPALLAKQSMLVTIKGVTLAEVGEGGKDFYFSIGTNKASLYISGTQCIDADAQEALKALFTANVGKTADITGFVGVYNNFQLMPFGETLDIKGAIELGAPVVTVDTHGLASWDAVPHAVKYEVKIGETVTEQTETEKQLQSGETITVKAIGDGTKYTDSDYSEPVTYTESATTDPVTNGVKFDMSLAINKTSTTAYTPETATPVFKTACADAADFSAITATANVYAELVNGIGTVKFSSSKNSGTATFTFAKNVKKVIIYCVAFNEKDTSLLAVNGSEAQTVGKTAGDLVFEITEATNTVKIDATQRCYVYAISVYFDKTILATPEVDVDDNGLASWDAVPHADGYEYSLDDGTTWTETKNTSIKLEDGQSIIVRAISNDQEAYVNSANSDKKSYVKEELTAPVVSATPMGAEWTEVPHATEYKYTIVRGEQTIEKTTKIKSVELEDGDKITVIAVGTGKYKNSKPSNEVTYSKPSQPVPIEAPKVEIQRNGYVEWNRDGANGYVVKINGDIKQFETNSTTLKDGETITVQALVDKEQYPLLEDSEFSKELTYKAPTKHGGVTGITVEVREGKALVKWTAPSTADDSTQYVVTLTTSEGDSTVTAEGCEALFDFANYTSVTVMAKGDGNDEHIHEADYSVRRDDGDPVDFTDAYIAQYDAVKVAAEKAAIELPAKVDAELLLDLPKAETYTDVTFEYSLDAEYDFVILDAEDGTLLITPASAPAEGATIKVTVTINCGSTTDTAEFEIFVKLLRVTSETFTFKSLGLANLTPVDKAITGLTAQLTFKKGSANTAPQYLESSEGVRVYTNSTLTISADNLKITKVEFTLKEGTFSAKVTPESGKLDNNIWEGTATEIIFTTNSTSNKADILSIKVTYEDPNYTDEQKVEKAFAALPEDIDFNINGFNVEVAGKFDSSITWSVTLEDGTTPSTAVTIDENGKATVTRSDADVVVKLHAQVSLNSAKSEVKTYGPFTIDKVGAVVKSWNKVTDISTLVDGIEVIIVTSNGNFAMGELSGAYAKNIAISVTDGMTTIPDGVVQYTIKKGASDNAFALITNEQYLRTTAAKNISLIDTEYYWNITISNGISTISASTTAHGSLKYNASSPRFTTYTSGQTTLSMYAFI